MVRESRFSGDVSRDAIPPSVDPEPIPEPQKQVGFVLPLSQYRALRDMAIRRKTSHAALLREWVEPHLKTRSDDGTNL